MLYILLLLTALLYPNKALAFTAVTGSYTGTGSDNTDITVGCQPVAVIAKRVGAVTDGEIKLSSMSGDTSEALTGTGSATTRIKSLLSNGFRLGTSTSTNSSGVDHRYLAICDDGSNDVAVGTYTGNGSDGVNITISPAFQPELVVLISGTTGVNTWRGSVHSGDSAAVINSPLANTGNHIQQFNADGFQTGSGSYANTIVYYYIAFKSNGSAVTTGRFSGTGTDNQDFTTGNIPKFVMIKGNSTTQQSSYRFSTDSGDNSYCDDAAQAGDIIQSLSLTDGFQVGTSTCANESGTNNMYWFSIQGVASSRPRGGVIFFQ